MAGRGSRFVGLVAALVLGGGSVAFGASVGLSSQRMTFFTVAGPPSGDTTAPALVSLEMSETGTPDGFVDRVVATFNEPLAAYTAGTSGWTLASSPSGRTLSTVAVTTGGTTATLTLAGGTTVADTAAGGFTVALAATAGGIRDAAGNRSSFATTAVTDKAGPVPTVLAIVNNSSGDSNGGLPGQGDFVRVTWSEKLAVSTVCSSWSGNSSPQSVTADNVVTVTLKDLASAPSSSDQLTVATSAAACGGALRFGTVVLSSKDYVAGTVTFGGAGGNASVISWTPASAQLVVTLGTPSTTTSLGDENSSNITATFTPASALQDVAGNAAAGSATATARHF